jgi:hypothetical protein
MRRLTSIFLHGFALDALLSVADEWFPVTGLRAFVAWSVFCVGLVLYVAAAFNLRLPKRLILPAFLFLVWTNVCGGFPLAFIIPDHYEAVLAWSQLGLAALLLLWHRRWGRIPPKLEAPVFSWAVFATLAILSILATPVVLAVSALNATGIYLEATSGGYVKLRPQGLLVEERELARGDQRVRLVSMVHIGEKTFYDRILASMPTKDSAVVLLEGVTDDQGLLKSHFSYSKIADLLGLTSQEKSEFQRDGKAASNDSPSPPDHSRVEYRHADVDISSFRPLTLEFMNAIGTILANPTASEVLHAVQDPNSPFRQPDADTVVMHDIVDKRNDHLLVEIDRALQTSQTVIVPWGALHLANIEAALKKQGFAETSHLSRPVIHFGSENSAVR